MTQETSIEPLVFAPMPEVRTERLVLRAWRDSDLAPNAQMNANPNVMEYFPKILTPEESLELVQKLQKLYFEHGTCFWVVEIPGVTPFAGILGSLTPGPDVSYSSATEIGWRLDQPYWGRGYATEGARAAMEDAFTRLGAPEVVAVTATTNLKSMKVMEKIGMKRDLAADFDHPRIPEGHPLRRHVLFRSPRRP